MIIDRADSVLRWVKVGEASVVVAISSPHRHDAQQAIGHVVEQLKARVPIWKKVIDHVIDQNVIDLVIDQNVIDRVIDHNVIDC